MEYLVALVPACATGTSHTVFAEQRVIVKRCTCGRLAFVDAARAVEADQARAQQDEGEERRAVDTHGAYRLSHVESRPGRMFLL
ncbi:MAG: hypothetical protein L6Q76_25565, partial [Polyangiaceae bacterium]|nr:hypothetical protein [Polyangiaceae bacterium]